MKRIFCFMLILTMLLSLLGCRSADRDDVLFYYSRNQVQYQYFEADGVIQSEVRDLTGHRKDLRYMVGLYLAGPLEEGMSDPFTKATRLESVENQEGIISIVLSDHTGTMTDSEFSLACACLTMTCMAFTACDTVSITSGERTVAMDEASILLFDSLPMQETTGG